MKYDYLIVGAGLFGAVFAHEAKKKGKKRVWLLISVTILQVIFTARKSKESMYTSTERTFSTPLIRKSGTISISLQSLIIISTLRLQYTRTSFTTCLLT